MATLTVRHSGDLARDREVVTLGWKRLRQWLWKRLGGKGRGLEFVLTWEVTPGTDGAGHVHAHVAMLLPWVDWHDVRAEWLRATGGASSNISLVTEQYSPAAAAAYLAKYASKGVQLGEWSPHLAARVFDSAYGKRLFSASQGFWRVGDGARGDRACCPGCKEGFRVLGFPPPMQPERPVWVTHGAGEIRCVYFEDEAEEPREVTD